MGNFYGGANSFSVQMDGPYGNISSSAKITEIILPAVGWKNAVSPFFQIVEVPGISENSMIEIQANIEQVAQLCIDGTAIHIENDGGVATAYAIGTKPEYDIALQVTVKEVVST